MANRRPFPLLSQVNPHLINYTTTVRKLFIIVETQKENYLYTLKFWHCIANTNHISYMRNFQQMKRQVGTYWYFCWRAVVLWIIGRPWSGRGDWRCWYHPCSIFLDGLGENKLTWFRSLMVMFIAIVSYVAVSNAWITLTGRGRTFVGGESSFW